MSARDPITGRPDPEQAGLETSPHDQSALDRLRTVLDAYGGDPARWPAADAAVLTPLLARSEPARRLQAEAVALDRWLDQVPEPAASPELLAAVLGAAERPAGMRLRALLWPFGPIWQPVSALLVALVLGAGAGQELMPPTQQTDSAAEAAAYAEDYTALALGMPYDYVVPE